MGVGNLATNLGNQEKIINEGALQPLLSLARRDNGDLESQRYAVFALTNVAATRSNHARLIGAGVCELMAALLEVDDVEIRNSAAFCVGNFASNPDNHATLLDEGVLGPLINLVASSDPQVRQKRPAGGAGRGKAMDYFALCFVRLVAFWALLYIRVCLLHCPADGRASFVRSNLLVPWDVYSFVAYAIRFFSSAHE